MGRRGTDSIALSDRQAPVHAEEGELAGGSHESDVPCCNAAGEKSCVATATASGDGGFAGRVRG